MDTKKFMWSIEKMVKKAHEQLPPGVGIILQLDNATYHCEPASTTLRSIIHPYPLVQKSRLGEKRNCMLSMLKQWKIKPASESDDWYNVIERPKRNITKSTSVDDRQEILKQRERINRHKKQITSLYRMEPQYRNQETRVDVLMKKLGEEIDRTITVL